MSVKFEEKEKKKEKKKEPVEVEPESFGERESVFEWEEGASGVVVSPFGEVRFEHPKGRKSGGSGKDWKWERMFGAVGGAVWGPVERWVRMVTGTPSKKETGKGEEEKKSEPESKPEPKREEPAKPSQQAQKPAPQPTPTQQSAQSQAQTVAPAMVKSVNILSVGTPEVTYYPEYGWYPYQVRIPFTATVYLDRPATGSEQVTLTVDAGRSSFTRTITLTPNKGQTSITVSDNVWAVESSYPSGKCYTVSASAKTTSPSVQSNPVSGNAVSVCVPAQSTPQQSTQAQTTTPALVKSVRLLDPPEGTPGERRVKSSDGTVEVPFQVEVELDKPATGKETLAVEVFYSVDQVDYSKRISVNPQAGATKVTATGTVRIPGLTRPTTFEVKARANTISPIHQSDVWSGKTLVTVIPETVPPPQPAPAPAPQPKPAPAPQPQPQPQPQGQPSPAPAPQPQPVKDDRPAPMPEPQPAPKPSYPSKPTLDSAPPGLATVSTAQSTPTQAPAQTTTPAMVKSVKLVSPPQYSSNTRPVYYTGSSFIETAWEPYTVEVELDRPATGSEQVEVIVEAVETAGWRRATDRKTVTPQAGATTVTVNGILALEYGSSPATYTVQARAKTVAPTAQDAYIYSGKSNVSLQPRTWIQSTRPSTLF